MALCKSVLQVDDILRELIADTCSDVFDNSDSESLDRDGDVSTTSSRKQLWFSVVVVTSDSETSTIEEESSELENSDGKTSDVWCKTDKKPNNEPVLGTTGLNLAIDNPESFVEVVSWSLVTILYCYLLNSLTFIIVKMQKNGKSCLKH